MARCRPTVCPKGADFAKTCNHSRRLIRHDQDHLGCNPAVGSVYSLMAKGGDGVAKRQPQMASCIGIEFRFTIIRIHFSHDERANSSDCPIERRP